MGYFYRPCALSLVLKLYRVRHVISFRLSSYFAVPETARVLYLAPLARFQVAPILTVPVSVARGSGAMVSIELWLSLDTRRGARESEATDTELVALLQRAPCIA